MTWRTAKHAYTRDEFYQFYGKMGYRGFHDFATWATLRKGDYKLHYDYQGKVELYNIAEDMFEKERSGRSQTETGARHARTTDRMAESQLQ